MYIYYWLYKTDNKMYSYHTYRTKKNILEIFYIDAVLMTWKKNQLLIIINSYFTENCKKKIVNIQMNRKNLFYGKAVIIYKKNLMSRTINLSMSCILLIFYFFSKTFKYLLFSIAAGCRLIVKYSNIIFNIAADCSW